METDPLDRALLEQTRAPNFDGHLEKNAFEIERDMAPLLRIAAGFACVPVSGFRVGAIAVGFSGRAYLGANLEFSGVPLSSSLHAEQSAVLNAWIHGESGVRALYVTEQPCGHCLQFLQELANAEELELHINANHATGPRQQIASFLPKPFLMPSLRKNGLFGRTQRRLVDIRESEDEDAVTRRAVNAAEHSYCPYSNSPEGFVIETIDGASFVGRGAESVAFNPSVPPVVAALNQRNLSIHRDVAISRAVHAKLATAVNHSLSLSRAILRQISKSEVESRLIEELI